MTGPDPAGRPDGASLRAIRRLWPASIRGQLILGVTLVHFVLVATFVVDLARRQRTFLSEQGLVHATSLTKTLALNGSSWVLANDVVGLQELVGSVANYPLLHYAMVVSPTGHVLAHTDHSRVGLYLQDGRSLAMLRGEPRVHTAHASGALVDVGAPVLDSTGGCIGWARVGYGLEDVARNLAAVERNGILYTLLACALGGAVALFIGIRLTSGLEKLVAVSSQVRDVGSTLRADTTGRDEIASLGRGFNEMLDAIQAHDRERRKLEDELRQSQKLESVGRLAGGVSHDFNNLLTAIIGNAQSLADALGPDHPLHADAQEILEAANKATGVTRALLAFSRKHLVAPKPVDVNEMVRQFERLLARVIGEDVAIAIRTSPEPLVVVGDRGQLEQVLLNLATNARDAMPKGGTLTLETGAEELSEEAARAHAGASPGRHAVITVRDTGHGLDEETRRHIFDPFFTTKEVGKGTGLGLTIVYGIVHQHGGFVDVESEPGKGATFRVFLPTTDAPVPAQAEQSGPRPPPPGGTETILLAEDDAGVRTLAERVLRDAGYTVLVAKDGEEAVDLFGQHADQVRLCLFDLVMPRKSGRQAYGEIAARHPGAPVLFASGWSPDASSSAGPPAGSDFIEKPYTAAELLRHVRSLLDR